MRELIFDPDGFFDGTRADRLSLAAAVVCLASLTSLMGPTVLTAASWETIRTAGEAVVAVYLLTVGFGAAGVFLTWILYAGIFYAVSALFGGTGEFRTVVTYVGWGFLPTALGGLVSAAAIVYVVQGVTFPREFARLQPFMGELTSGPLFVTTSVVGIALTLWSGLIWTFALRQARDIELREAVLTVAVTVLPAIAWQCYGLL